MASLKQQAVETIQSLPDDADLMDIIERLLLIRRMRRAIATAPPRTSRRLADIEGIGDDVATGRDHDRWLYEMPSGR